VTQNDLKWHLNLSDARVTGRKSAASVGIYSWMMNRNTSFTTFYRIYFT